MLTSVSGEFNFNQDLRAHNAVRIASELQHHRQALLRLFSALIEAASRGECRVFAVSLLNLADFRESRQPEIFPSFDNFMLLNPSNLESKLYIVRNYLSS